MANLIFKTARKARQILRAVYASTSSSYARELVHKINTKDAAIQDLKDRLIKNSEQNRRLNQRNQQLNELRTLAEDANYAGSDVSSVSVEELQFELMLAQDKLRDMQTAQAPQRGSALAVQKLRSANENLKEKLQKATAFNRTYGVAVRYLAQENNLNSNAFKVAGLEAFDIVFAHDILGIYAARSLADHFNAKLFVDVVEEYDLMKRSGAFFRNNLSESESKLINTSIKNMMLSAQKFIHIGPRQIDKFQTETGKQGVFLPNFRNAFNASEQIVSDVDALLQSHDLSGKDFVCVPNRIIHAEEITLLIGGLSNAKAKLPIVHVGHPLEDELSVIVEDACKEKGIKFIELGLLDYDIYREVLARSLFCSFLTTETIYNVKYAFPNRLFDAISTRTPILVSGFVQVGEFVKEKAIGVYVDEEPTMETIGKGIEAVIKNKSTLEQALEKQSGLCSWDAVFNEAFKAITGDQKILIITRKDVRKNQRIQNLRQSFMKKGCAVTVIGGNNTEYDLTGKKFYTVPLNRPVTDDELFDDITP